MKARRRRVKRLSAPPVIPKAGPKGVAVDTETTGIRMWQGDQPYAISFCNEWGEMGYFEWPVDPFTRQVTPDHDELEKLKEFAYDDTITKVWWNGPFDRRITHNAFGVEWRGENEEGIYAAHTCKSDEMNYQLKYLSNKYLGIDKRDMDELRARTKSARAYGKREGWKVHKEVPPDYWMVGLAFPESAHLVQTYALIDAERTMGLMFLYQSLMDKNPRWRKVYEREKELEPVVKDMENRGIRVSPRKCKTEWDACDAEEKEALAFLRKSTGDPEFTVTDNNIRWLVYEFLGEPVTKRTKKAGLPSVDAGTMVSFQRHPEVQSVFRYKIAAKGKSAFFENYLDFKVPDHVGDEWVIHPSFFQSEKKTGRFSCRWPNLQQVPDAISTRATRPIQGRGPFGPRKNYWWYLIDYSQLEARVFASVANEPTMRKAFEDGRDLHTECANRAWGGFDTKRWPHEDSRLVGVNPAGIRAAINALGMDGITVGGHDVAGDVAKMRSVTDRLGWEKRDKFHNHQAYQVHMDELAAGWLREFGYDIVKAEKSIGKKNTRAKAKMVLFARTFGGGPNAIKDLMYTTYDEAKAFLAEYALAFPRIEAYIAERSAEAFENGGIWNLYDRWLSVDRDFSYKAVNYTVQGSAADQLKIAMIKVAKYLRMLRETRGIDVHLVLTIHDELVIEGPPDLSPGVIAQICHLMEDSEGKIDIATPVDVEIAEHHWTVKRSYTDHMDRLNEMREESLVPF